MGGNTLHVVLGSHAYLLIQTIDLMMEEDLKMTV